MKTHALPVSIILLLAAILSAAQIPTFSIRTEEVRVDVLVSKDRKPVSGLKADDFEIFDNEVRQAVRSESFQQVPISVTLVLDMSESVSGDLADHLKAAGRALLSGLKKNERAALITFSHSVRLGCPTTTDLDRVRAALDRGQPEASGRTSMIDASYAGLIQAESKADRPLLIMFSDGLDIGSWLTSEAVLDTTKFSDAVVYAVSAGRVPDRRFLQDITKITGGSFMKTESNKDLSAVFVGILEEFRQRYLLTYAPEGVPKGGWHELRVQVKRRGLEIKHRPGYLKDPAARTRADSSHGVAP